MMVTALTLDTRYLLSSPAKINIRLKILKKRIDGYHDIITDIYPIDFCDQIVLFPHKKPAWQAHTSPASSIIQKSLALLEQELKQAINLDFRVVKRIPWQAGLGGSSGNAGTVLRFLQQFFTSKPVDWQKIALATGSDVAFFLRTEAAIASGRGEILTPLKVHHIHPIVIGIPEFRIDTKTAYEKVWPQQEALESLDLQQIETQLPTVNHFWHTNQPYYKELLAARTNLLTGDGVKNVLMTGSGSALILFFHQAQQRDHFFTKQSFAEKSNLSFYTANICPRIPLQYFRLAY